MIDSLMRWLVTTPGIVIIFYNCGRDCVTIINTKSTRANNNSVDNSFVSHIHHAITYVCNGNRVTRTTN